MPSDVVLRQLGCRRSVLLWPLDTADFDDYHVAPVVRGDRTCSGFWCASVWKGALAVEDFLVLGNDTECTVAARSQGLERALGSTTGYRWTPLDQTVCPIQNHISPS